MWATIDLKELERELDGHIKSSDITAWCPRCNGIEISQADDECPECGTIIIWENSPAWRQIHGTPAQMRRKLSAIMPEGRAGRLLISLSRTAGFRGTGEARRWAKARELLSEDILEQSVKDCYSGGDRGRGLIVHVLNLVEQKTRSRIQVNGDTGEVTWI